MAAPVQPQRLTNAIVEAGLVLATAALGVAGLPWAALAVTVTAALGWWVWRHRASLRMMAQERPGRLALMVSVSVAMIVAVHAAFFWVARSVHGAG
jgi:hypothetical protein